MKTFSDFNIDIRPGASGETKTTCPRCSPSRKKTKYPCLNVNIDQGVWNCWHCGWSGTLKGGEWQRPEIRKEYRRPDYVASSTGLPEKVVEWFRERGITDPVIKRKPKPRPARAMDALDRLLLDAIAGGTSASFDAIFAHCAGFASAFDAVVAEANPDRRLLVCTLDPDSETLTDVTEQELTSRIHRLARCNRLQVGAVA